jgi:Peptidase C13 family
MQSRVIQLLFIAVLSLFLSACATSPYSQTGQEKTKTLLDQQISQAKSLRSSDAEPRIFYVGAALHSQSRAFREDVLLVESTVRKMDSKAITIKLGNSAFGQDSDWPSATKESLTRALEAIAQIAQADDKIVVMISSHGSVGSLSVNANNQELPAIKASDLAFALKQISAWPSMVVVSACFSGSLIDTIKANNRIVYTAADKDRASFGCNFHSKNTFFIEEFFGSQWNSTQSVQDNFLSARTRVAEREKAMKIGPPSIPRYQFGGDARLLTETPLTSWRVTPLPTKQ